MITRWRRPGLEFALYVVIEGLLYRSYQHNDARFHWFLHFFVGSTVALLVLAGVTIQSGRVVRRPLLWLLLAHLVAMTPDILFSLTNLPHEQWMDIFLLHISAHFTPGRNWTWYGIFLVSLALYLAVRASAERMRSSDPRRL